MWPSEQRYIAAIISEWKKRMLNYKIFKHKEMTILNGADNKILEY